jgi:adenylate cyclase
MSIMRIVVKYQNTESTVDFAGRSVLIGRGRQDTTVDLDLSYDLKVSRRHARIWVEDGQPWLEDLDSAHGTLLNGVEIKQKGKQLLRSGDIVTVGSTVLGLYLAAGWAEPSPPPVSDGAAAPSKTAVPPLGGDGILTAAAESSADVSRRLALFYELLLRFGKETQIDALFQLIIDRVLDLLPDAASGALLVKESGTGTLMLKAHLPEGKPVVSLTMAQKAIDKFKSIIWPPFAPTLDGYATVEQPVSDSATTHQIQSAIYTPLLWRGKALGVICVNSGRAGAFQLDDLRLLQAIAHHAAMAVANLQLQDEWRQLAEVQSNLLKLFSPQVAERIGELRGRLRPGGQFRRATIMFSDIRGFTKLSASMSNDDVADMLEDYFGRLVPLVFKYQGTIDKFVGDAILAVFGSPKHDEHQHLHALQAAIEMQKAMQEVNAQRAAQGKRIGALGIGIHSGEVVHGLIGSRERMEFTVIGDTVNRASRFCDGAAGGEVLISRDMYESAWSYIQEAEKVSIATKHEGEFDAFRIKGLKPAFA